MNHHVRNIYFCFTFCTIFVKLVTLKPTRAYKSPRQSKFKKTKRFIGRFHEMSSAILVNSNNNEMAAVLVFQQSCGCFKTLFLCKSVAAGPLIEKALSYGYTLAGVILLILMCQLEAHLFSKQNILLFRLLHICIAKRLWIHNTLR